MSTANTAIEQAIEQLTFEIGMRQDCLSALHRLKTGQARVMDGAQFRQLEEVPKAVVVKVKGKRGGMPAAGTRVATEPKAKRKYTKRVTGFQPMQVGKGTQLETRVTRPSSTASTERGGATSIVDKLDKPTSLGGAMKYIIRMLKAPFDIEGVRAELKADGDFAKLLEGSSDSAVNANWSYWVAKGKLEAHAGGFKIAAGCTFFEPAG